MQRTGNLFNDVQNQNFELLLHIKTELIALMPSGLPESSKSMRQQRGAYSKQNHATIVLLVVQ